MRETSFAVIDLLNRHGAPFRSQNFMAKSLPPPPGIYVPAVIFFNENDELDIDAIKTHALRLAKVEHTARQNAFEVAFRRFLI